MKTDAVAGSVAGLILAAKVAELDRGTAGQRKFTLGTDAVVNENTKVYQFVAIGI